MGELLDEQDIKGEVAVPAGIGRSALTLNKIEDMYASITARSDINDRAEHGITESYEIDAMLEGARDIQNSPAFNELFGVGR